MKGVTRLARVGVVALWPALVMHAEEATIRQLSLDQAIVEALDRSPTARARRAAVEEAEARLVTAETYPHDPELQVRGADREGDAVSSTDWNVQLTQPIEIGGQRSRRMESASTEVAVADAGLRREERLLQARVTAVFVESLRARELLDVERANADLVQSLSEVARRRFEAGDVPEIEVNLALAQLGRAQRSLRLAQAAYDVARATLAEVVGLDPVLALEPVGELELPRRAPAPVSELVHGAIRHRADLEALRNTIEAARARVELARSDAVPDLRVKAFYGREEGTDRLIGGSIGIRIPIFNRNQGAIAEARAAEHRASADRDAAELRIRREVVEARARYEAALDASELLRESVLGTLEENLSLLERSFEAGKVGWTDVLVFRREFIDSRRDYVESLADAWYTAVELDLAAGRSAAPQPESPGGAAGARIVTEDIGRLWEAYDAAAEGANLEESLQELYLDRGSPGLQDFVELRIESAAQLAATIETMPGYYASIRSATLRVAEMEPEIRDALLALEKLYPEAAFPDVYFVIGRLTSGGTTSSRGLLIGTEMYGLTDDAPMEELDAWLRSVLEPIDRVPHIVAHELVHFQQPPLGGETLLESCYREGSADFIAELISGDHINGHVHEWALPREAEVWVEFQERMHDEETDGWLYGGQPEGRPPDLGYFIGYRIAQAYYEKSPDKPAAVAEILRATDINAFLAASGYDPR